MDGKPYPVAVRLYAVAIGRWAELDAEYIHIDLMGLPPHRFCNLIYTWCLKHIKEDDREMWLMQLNQPLPGYEDKVTDSVAEDEGAAFMAMMDQNKQLTGSGN